MQLPRFSTAKGSVAGPAAPTWEAELPVLWRPSRRFLGLVALVLACVALLAYLVMDVSLSEPTLTRAEAHRYWLAALVGALVVLAGVALVTTEVLRARRASPAPAAGVARSRSEQPPVPRSLWFERVPGRVIALVALISLAGVTACFVAGTMLWVGGLAFLVPWLPVLAIEARWKYATYGIFAMFLLLCVMQVLHMGEHSMQVGQLIVHRGDLAQAHGVFGQLDFELIHFVTDTTLWIILGLLLIIYKGRNPWLWVAFAAASLHQVEHLYLFWMYQTHESYYAAGGFAGIMGESGMIGSPLDRPYLHFTYNLIVLVPMLIALWDQARLADRGFAGDRS